MNRPNGFTILEVLIALVILSVTTVSVWQVFGLVNRSGKVIESNYSHAIIYEYVKDHLDVIDIHSVKKGELSYLDYYINWSANPLRMSNEEEIRKHPAWFVGLFEVKIEVFRDNQIISSYTMKTTRQWLDPNYVPPELRG